MPRDLPVANGNLLITFDRRYNLRDVYYPFVGMEDHTIGEPCRFGVWADGAFAWIDADGVNHVLGYQQETLVTEVRSEIPALGLRLECRDAVDFDRNIYLKAVTVYDTSGKQRTVRLFQHFDAHLYGLAIGDSAYFDPRSRGLVFYKQRRYFILCGGLEGAPPGLASYAIGEKEVHGREGTWRDAEDGELSRNAVAQGSIDGIGMLELKVPANGKGTAHFWLCAGQSYHEVHDLDGLVHTRGPESFLQRTADYWRLWANLEPEGFDELGPELCQLYKRSLLTIRSQVDERGAILAGNDSDILRFGRDTYSYMWPRDGALVAEALDLCGYGEVARRFFSFCGDAISREGYLQHKYNPDGSVGSSWHPWSTPDGRLELPIQEDETGLVLWALWRHYDRGRDIEFVRPLYRKLIRSAADFMVNFREPRTRLPAPSHDLWEERRGIHAWTVAAVWAGLSAAHNFANAFGQRELAQRYGGAAEEIRAAALEHLYDQERGRFLRTIEVLSDGTVVRDGTLDASIAGVFLFGMLPPDDARVVATMRAIEEQLWVKTDVGGVARYQDDYYFRQSDAVPGNPWFISTLWVAEWYAACAKKEADLDRPVALLSWCAQRALPSGILSEQLHPFTGEPLSVSPLTWSHAQLVSTLQQVLRRRRELKKRLVERIRATGELSAATLPPSA